MKTFAEVFGGRPETVANAPGRVNLLGEHTDYNDGYVLPIAIPWRTTVALARRAAPDRGTGAAPDRGPGAAPDRGPGAAPDRGTGAAPDRGTGAAPQGAATAPSAPTHALYAAAYDRCLEFSLRERPDEAFARYVYGCLVEAEGAGAKLVPLAIHVASEVPIGVGLSSSAALEVATLRALRELFALPWSDVRIAQLGQAAEIRHAGVACGIMDQMAASLADADTALFLDTRTLATRRVPLPQGSAVLVLDSGVARALTASAYNLRRQECEAAARQLGVAALRDVDDLAALSALPEPLLRRARHVVSENARVLAAVSDVAAARFGELMNASHASLRDDYEVSVGAVDTLVALLQAHPAVYGARMTGAGFGGACVALCRSGPPSSAAASSAALPLAAIASEVLEAYAARGYRGRQLVP